MSARPYDAGDDNDDEDGKDDGYTFDESAFDEEEAGADGWVRLGERKAEKARANATKVKDTKRKVREAAAAKAAPKDDKASGDDKPKRRRFTAGPFPSPLKTSNQFKTTPWTRTARWLSQVNTPMWQGPGSRCA